MSLSLEVGWSQEMGEVIVRMTSIQGGDEVRVGSSRADHSKIAEWTASAQVQRRRQRVRLWRRKRVRKLQVRVVLCLESVFNVLVQLLITASGLGSVQITPANYFQVRSCKVECLSDKIEISYRDELFE